MAHNNEIKEYTTKAGDIKYRFRLYLGISPETGKKVEVTRSNFRTYTEANLMYQQLQRAGVPTTSKKRITFEDVYKDWLEVHKQSIKPSSVYAIKSRWKNHIEPYLGKYLINRINPNQLQRYANELPARFVNYKTILAYVHSIFDYAVRMRMIENNPADRILIPQNDVRERRNTEENFLETEELIDFLKAAKQVNLQVYTYFSILAYCGLRLGEGLTVKYSDFTEEELHVQRTLTKDENGKKAVGSPKSYTSDRVLPITHELWLLVQEYHLQQFVKSDYLFCGRDGEPLTAAQPRNWLALVYSHLGPDFKRITVHGLRHSFASRLYAADPDIKIKDVADMLGDKTLKVATEVYMHTMRESTDRVTKAIKAVKLI